MARSQPEQPDGQPASFYRRLVARLAAADASPRRAAAAFALGVFLSFSPLLGLQIGVGLGAALVLRLSRAAVFIGLCLNMPWIMIPYYALTTAFGAAALGVPLSGGLTERLSYLFELPVYTSIFWGRAGEVLMPLAVPFAFGTTCGAAVLGCSAYIVTRWLLETEPRRRGRAAASDASVTDLSQPSPSPEQVP